MKRATILTIVTVSIISIISINLSCTKDNSPAGTITFLSGEVTINDTSPSLGQRFNVSDSIVTGDSSLAVVQFDDNALMVIRSNSRLKLSSIKNEKGTLYVEIDQQEGNSFHKVIKGTTKYIVNTSTLKAAVKGTAFSVQTSEAESTSRVRLLEGTVNVSPKKVSQKNKEMDTAVAPGDDIILQPGHEIQVSGDAATRPIAMGGNDKSELEKLNRTAFIENINEYEERHMSEKPFESKEKKDLTIGEKPVIPLNIEKEIITIDKQPVEWTKKEKDIINREVVAVSKLDKIKKKNNGRLDIITLKSGKKLKGMILERGMMFKIETPDGIEYIEKSQIESQTITQ